MATRGSIGKIALDAILEPATIPLVTPQQAVKLSRGLFKDMLNQLGGRKELVTSQGARSGVSPDFGKQTEQRFSAIENILKKRNADPTPLISDAISTGRINGQKLSSSERNELAARLQILNAYKTGNMPNARNDLNANTPSFGLPDPSEQFYTYNWDLFETPEMLSKGFIRDAYAMLEKRAPKGSALERMAEEGWRRNVFGEDAGTYILNNPLTNPQKFTKEKIINQEVFGQKGTFGRGYRNVYSNRDIKESLRLPTLYNNIIKRYDITDKKVGETIYSLLPEWKGSIQDLIALARMLNP